MHIQQLHKIDIQKTQNHWVQAAIDIGKTDEELELIEQLFDYIDASTAYGDIDLRNNLNTYVGIIDDNGSIPSALVEVISHRRGRERTIKIVNIAFSPAIEALEEIEYDDFHAATLLHVVQDFVARTQSPGSSTKIYARNNRSEEFLKKLHLASQQFQAQFDELGLSIQFEGKRWLAFTQQYK